MRKLLIFILVFILGENIFAQSGWYNVYTNTNSGNLLNVFFVNQQTGFVVGAEGTFLKTTNAGINWTLSQISNQGFRPIYFINEETGFIGSASQKYIFKTTNSGISWDSIQVQGYVSSIYFLNNNTGVSTWLGYGIYKTTNSGTNWFLTNWDGASAALFGSIHFIGNGTGYLWRCSPGIPHIPDNFTIYKTSDEGDSWIPVIGTTGSLIKSIRFVNETTGFAIFYTLNTTFLKRSTNGGTTWNNLISVGSADFGCEIQFLPPNLIYYGRYKTTNFGQSWILYNVNVTNVSSMFFINAQTGILTSENKIFRTTDGGEIISSIYSEQNPNSIPKKHSLSQNYPNPFNPSTRINYELKQSGFTTLKVFDLLGKEVATLVNEKQNAGSYAVDFNSTEYNLPSGIYFYTLNAGEFKETRKMILIK